MTDNAKIMMDSENFPVEIVLECDGCGAIASEDYVTNLNESKADRFLKARTYMAMRGWSSEHGANWDWCPECTNKAKEKD